jgi:predicted nucleic acid-binding protein
MNLAAVGRLDLLESLYGHILIPQAVFHEVAVLGAGKPGSLEVSAHEWIETVAVADRALVTRLTATVDAGEAEAIACALERSADLLLIDEKRGRSEAAALGVRRIGILGVLRDAKRAGLVAAVRPLLDELRSVAHFWISDATYDAVLSDVGELP